MPLIVLHRFCSLPDSSSAPVRLVNFPDDGRSAIQSSLSNRNDEIKSMITEFRVIQVDQNDVENHSDYTNYANRSPRNSSNHNATTNAVLVAQPASAAVMQARSNDNTWSSSAFPTYVARLKLIRQSEIYCWSLYVPTVSNNGLIISSLSNDIIRKWIIITAASRAGNALARMDCPGTVKKFVVCSNA